MRFYISYGRVFPCPMYEGATVVLADAGTRRQILVTAVLNEIIAAIEHIVACAIIIEAALCVKVV